MLKRVKTLEYADGTCDIIFSNKDFPRGNGHYDFVGLRGISGMTHETEEDFNKAQLHGTFIGVGERFIIFANENLDD